MIFDQHYFQSLLNNLPSIAAVPCLTSHVFDSIPSTNRVLWDLLEQGTTAGTIAIALEQTAGRGQWGRQWVSTRGGLYLSLLLTPQMAIAESALLTLGSAWGIATALRQREIPVGIKWPNDLILADRKLGGILTETRISQGQIAAAVVGVGINWQNAVPETGINLQAGRQGAIASLEELAAVTVAGILSGYPQSGSEQTINALLAGYQDLLVNMGQSVMVGDRPGIVVGVDRQGNLRVKLNPKPDAFVTPKTASNFTQKDDIASEISVEIGTISLGYKDTKGHQP